MRRLNSQKPDGKLLEDFKATFPHIQQRSHSLAAPPGHSLADALDVANPSRYVFPRCPPSHVSRNALSEHRHKSWRPQHSICFTDSGTLGKATTMRISKTRTRLLGETRSRGGSRPRCLTPTASRSPLLQTNLLVITRRHLAEPIRFTTVRQEICTPQASALA